MKKADHGDTLRRLIAAGGEAAERRRRLESLASISAAPVQKGIRDYWSARISATAIGAEALKPQQLATCAAGAGYRFRLGLNDMFVVLDHSLVAAAAGWELSGELRASEDAAPCAAIDRRIAQRFVCVIAAEAAAAIFGDEHGEPDLVAAAESLETFDVAATDEPWVSASVLLRNAEEHDLGAATVITLMPGTFAAEDTAGGRNGSDKGWKRAIEKAAYSAKTDIRVIVSRRMVDYRSLSEWKPGVVIPLDESMARRGELMNVSHGRCQRIAAGEVNEDNGRRTFEVSHM